MVIFGREPQSGFERVEIQNVRGHGVAGGPNEKSYITISGWVGPFDNTVGCNVRAETESISSEPAIFDAFPKEVRGALVTALADSDPFVRRRACEALIRAGFEPPLDALWPLLAEKDPFVRTAARLTLQRIDAAQWTPRLWREQDETIVREGIVALCKTGQAAAYATPILTRLASGKPPVSAQEWLDYVRTLQLVLFHTIQSVELLYKIS